MKLLPAGFRRPAILALAPLAAGVGDACAHASDRGFVLLLPTGHYIVGGALAVAASFAVLLLLRPGALCGFAAARSRVLATVGDWRTATSLLAFACLAMLVTAGFIGSRDPLSNPLPLVVWTLFWIGLTLICGLFGNAFVWVNPWLGPCRMVRRLLPERYGSGDPHPVLDRLGYLPAIVQLLAFAWFELVYPAPDDPARLAWAVSFYWLLNFAAMLAFGCERWMRTGECFSVFFRLVSRLGTVVADRSAGRFRLSICLPGGKLRDVSPLPLGGVACLLLALGSVSFDGLMRTFAWLGKIGVNPLEFPGRSAVMMENSAGLVAVAAALTALFLAAVSLGERMTRTPVPWRDAAGLLVWSIVPIALAYHFSHYLTVLLVNGQYALIALSDPFALGWDLFGTANLHVRAGIAAGSAAAWTVWNLQAGVIIAGHVLAVLVAHGLAARLHASPREAALSQLPLTLLMIAYTVFGLWLLSTPTAA